MSSSTPRKFRCRKGGVFAAEVDGHIVMMDANAGEYFGLNTLGAFVWELLETPLSRDEIVKVILEEFDVSVDQCKADIERFLEHGIRVGLIVQDQSV